ncbi:MAG: DNA ligase, partial [Gemmatimonadales bacterium]
MRSQLRSALPSIPPIVPTLKPDPFNHPAWLFEPKYDGFRGMLYLSRSGCNLYSKRGNLMTRFAGLARQLAAELGARELILDGEIVALDDEGRIDFWGLMRGQGTLAYAAFDLLWLNGQDLRPRPLHRRKQR